MGTAGRSGAPTGRGTHSRSELPHPTSPHLATSNFQQLLKKAKILHFWQVLEAEAGWTGPERPRRPVARRVSAERADCAVGSG